MRRKARMAMAATATAALGLAALAARAETGAKTWSFDAEPADAPPVGFDFGRTGSGKPGRWVVRAELGAPSGGKVLAQLDADDTDYRFPVAVARDGSWTDVRVSVKCKAVSGEVDQACGLVARYADAENYYVTRANALEGNVRLYYVKAGKRKQLASWSGTVTKGAWHNLRLDVKGAHLEVFWDGVKVIAHDDTTFTGPGKVGVWTKADSVTLFDDLSATPL